MASNNQSKNGGGWVQLAQVAAQVASQSGGKAESKPAFNQINGLSFGGQTDTYATHSQKTANEQSEAMDQAASMFSAIPGGFGQGFQYGYAGAKMTVAPFIAYRAAKQQKQILGLQAQLSDLQAKAYQTAAEDVLRAGQRQVAAITYQAGQARASTRVAQATSGVRIAGAGSAAETLASQAIVTEMQVNQVLANAVTQSFGYQRAKTQQKINSLSIRSAQSSISPWAASIVAHISSVAESMPSADIGSFGGGKGSGKNAPTKGGANGGAQGPA